MDSTPPAHPWQLFAGSNASASGTSGNGGPATSALFGAVGGLALSRDGGLTICDRDFHRVQHVDPATSVVTTIAGSAAGVSGTTGDGGPATAALLDGPEGVAYDSKGGLVFTEIGAHRVRYVDPSMGTIRILAGSPTGVLGKSGLGGPAASALLDGPRDLALDASDNIYIADSGNHRIVVIDAASGLLTLIAGRADGSYGCGPWSGGGSPATSTALYYPIGITVDRAGGGLAIADSYNNHVAYVTLSTGTIRSIAGYACDTASTYGGDGGPAVAAYLHTPSKLAYDSRGDLAIGDYFNEVVRVIGFYPWGTPPTVSATPTTIPNGGSSY